MAPQPIAVDERAARRPGMLPEPAPSVPKGVSCEARGDPAADPARAVRYTRGMTNDAASKPAARVSSLPVKPRIYSGIQPTGIARTWATTWGRSATTWRCRTKYEVPSTASSITTP